MRKLVLINPPWTKESFSLWRTKYLHLPPLNLEFLAGAVPENWQIEIIDGNVEAIPQSIAADLVGITSMTALAPSVYKLSARIQKSGIPVILGGIHPSMLPNEAKRHADSVIVGEAETVLPRLLKDFEKGSLKRIYKCTRQPLDDLPKPRRDLLNNRKYFLQLVQTTRGCPFSCEFCSVSAFAGMTYRRRPLNIVLDEIAEIKGKNFVFSDDNLVGVGEQSTDYVMGLFSGMKHLNKRWASQASINIADNDKILSMAADAGCKGLFIGFESVNPDTLKQMGKSVNLRKGIGWYRTVVKKIHEHGIAVVGGFVFGSDTDDKTVFKATENFINEVEIDASTLTALTPLPGTRLYKRLNSEKRIIKNNYPSDWALYDCTHAVFKPKQMTEQELENGLLDSYNVNAPVNNLFRSFRTLWNTKSMLSAATMFKFNEALFNAVRERKAVSYA